MSENWAAIPAAKYPLMKKLKRTRRRWGKEWIYTDGKRYYHKDPLHGEVEVYDSRGNHIGVMTPDGNPHPKKGQDKTKTIKHLI